MSNANLNVAKMVKNDEFYTRLPDIEQELAHYRKHFKDKTVLCNCDDPFESNFFKYFVLNFEKLGLKKLITTCYAGSPVAGVDLECPNSGHGYVAVVTKVYDTNGDGLDMDDIKGLFEDGTNELRPLDGDGDFRSDECVDLLKQADIVVTNPPFSLFKEYVAQLMEYKKHFLIIGNKNAISLQDVFSLIKDSKLWLGYTSPRGFDQPDGAKKRNMAGLTRWFTNLDISKRHEKLLLIDEYDPDMYPKYDNYNGIEVSAVADIPCDYDGIMGVPITFMDKYNPEQFELLGITDRNNKYGLTTRIYTREDCPNYSDCNRRAALRQPDGSLKSTFPRILIRRKDG